MTPSGKDLQLNPDEFAFYFEGGSGIEASELGAFLQRAAVVARKEGVEIRVLGLEPGSLLVRLRALKKSTVYRNAKKEFVNKPLTGIAQIAGTATAATAIVTAVVAAISWAFDDPDPTPLAKSGAEVAEKCSTQINLITVDNSILLMDEEKARDVKKRARRQSSQRRLESPDEVRLLTHDAAQGTLIGEIADLNGELHFRPEDFRFWVPIQTLGIDVRELAAPAIYRVRGELVLRRGRPDSILIEMATRL